MRLIQLALAGAAAVVAAACEPATAPGTPAAIETTDSLDLAWGTQAGLQARVVDAGGGTVDAVVTWYSLDTTVATVDQGGRVEAVGLGVARIVAAADTLATTVRVRVVTPIAEIAIGTFTSCLRSTDDEVFCWGGYLDLPPQHVPGARGLSRLTIHYGRACGLDVAGAAWCWGAGLPGNGSNVESAVPVRVAGGATFGSLVVGTLHSCGIEAGGALRCWGRNFFYSMTSEVPDSANAPMPAATALRFAAASAGYTTTCGATTSGEAWCWGNNNFDHVGIAGNPGACGGDPCVAVPSRAVADSAFVWAGTSGYHSCALTASGQAWCWGGNYSGELGDSVSTGCWFRPTGCSTLPQRVNTAVRFRELVLGDMSCGLSLQEEVWCWGPNRYGQLGDGTQVDHAIPARVSGNLRFVSLRAGSQTVCGIATNGRAYCWGTDFWNQLNNGPGQQDRDVPTLMAYQP